MSQENVEILHRLVDAWNRQDIEQLLFLTDPEAEYVNARDAVEPGTRQGHDQVVPLLQAQRESLPGARAEIDRLHVRGDEIIVVARISRRMPGSEARLGNRLLVSYRFRDGKVARIEVLGTGTQFRQALEAARLQE